MDAFRRRPPRERPLQARRLDAVPLDGGRGPEERDRVRLPAELLGSASIATAIASTTMSSSTSLKGDAVEDRGTLWVAPGGRARADAFPLRPEYLRPIASIGMEFEVCEGARVVAQATIEDIIDPGPESDIV